ncbi:spindle pole body interacting protein [Panus rudis PR-1116 ss-1]|nr:spindle pole body interacting protein [Panus rudis PR-1116 ss-1]
MAGSAQHCSFVLLADFDIDRGAQLTYQFPQPLGTDEGLLANLMLPDGAERQPEDWTIFFLNQTPFNTISPVLALDPPVSDSPRIGTAGEDESEQDGNGQELLYVLNLVRTKLDKTVRRGAIVKAMAICTRHSFIEIFKPVLLIALDDYFSNPSQDCLARLFDAINSMDISNAPNLTRYEKIILRTSERKDSFIERYEEYLRAKEGNETSLIQGSIKTAPSSIRHRATDSTGSHSSFEDGFLARGKERDKRSGNSTAAASATNLPQVPDQPSPLDTTFSLDGSAVWVGDESGLDQVISTGTGQGPAPNAHVLGGERGRRSTDASSSASSSGFHGGHGKRDEPALASTTAYDPLALKDTHFLPAQIFYGTHKIPIKVPMTTFPEEVGDYSLIQLVQMFSSPSATISGPLHPHLHTSGPQTHPIIILFNALVTEKRIIFLGHHRPAGQVSSYVLSACALGSGCGIILRGFIKRAFPYANLINREEWESIPGYIAGVTNPIFEASGSWDLLCDVGSGRMVVSKDIHLNYPASTGPPPLITRTGTLKTEASLGSEEDMVRPSKDLNVAERKVEVIKGDNPDNLFMEDITSAISFHYGEAHVRARFTDYAARFVRLAARYEEDVLGISTTIGYPSVSYSEHPPRLGSGLCFADEIAGARELSANASRIEAFRKTEAYTLCQADMQKALKTNPIQGFDLSHQLWRFRHARRMADGEVELIMRTLAENVRTYEQVTELLSLLPPHHNGLLPLSFCLFHQQETIRDLTVDLFNELRSYPIGVQFLQGLNHFQRYAYVRQAHARESRIQKEQQQLTIPLSNFASRTPSNRSESSLAGG